MDNLVFGIAAILFSTFGYGASWHFYQKNQFKTALFLLLLSGLILRIYSSTDFYLHTWDERYHALVAKNLMEHPLVPTLYDNPVLPYDYENWTANHVWLHKQPFPLWTMAASMWLFGVHEIALRIPSMIMTTVGIWLTFSIGTFFFNKKAGYWAAFLYSINGLILELTGGRVATDHIDVFFLFFIELAVYFCIVFIQQKKTIYTVLSGICIGIAILSKWLPALIVFPIWLLLTLDSKAFSTRSIVLQFIVLLTVCTMVFLPWQCYIFDAFPTEAKWESTFNFKHLTQDLEGRGRPFYYFVERIGINYGSLIYLPIIWFFWSIIKKPFDKKRLALFTWFAVPLIFFSFAKTKMQGYLLFTSPALFIVTAAFYLFLSEYRKTHRPKWLMNGILILLIGLPIRYAIERLKPFEERIRNPQWVADLKRLNQEGITDGVLFNYERSVETMFYTEMVAYPYLPDKKTIAELLEKGHSIIINDDGTLPEQFKTIEKIHIKKIAQ